MSLSIDPIDLVEIQEPTIQIKEKKTFGVFKGGSDNIYYTFTADSSSTSQSVWNINVPSENVFVDRKMYLSMSVRLTIDGDGGVGNYLIQSGFDSLRAFPLSNSMATLTVNINNGSTSIRLNEVIQALMRYASMDELYYEFSNTPTMMDQSQTYESLISSQRNPLNSYLDSEDGAFQPRGAFRYSINTNGIGVGTQSIIDFQIVEPLMCSPLHFNRSFANGFIGLKQFTAQIVWDQDLGAKMFSHMNGASTISNISVSFNSNPQILMRTITPSEISELSLPQISVYPYHSIRVYKTPVAEVLSLQDDIQSTNSVQLDVIPRRIFFYVQRKNSEKTFNHTDSFFSIDKISINFANKSGLLSSATKRDLYNISKKNGVNMTYQQWSGEPMLFQSGSSTSNIYGAGSVLCLYIPEDLALTNGDLLAPGVQKKVNIQAQLTYTNWHPTDDIAPDIYMVVDNEGLFTISEGLGLQQIGILTEQDVLTAPSREDIDYEDVLDLYGGDFFSDIGSFLKKIPQGIADVADFTKENILPIAQLVSPFLGAGSGGKLIGGKKMTKKDLMKKRKKQRLKGGRRYKDY